MLSPKPQSIILLLLLVFASAPIAPRDASAQLSETEVRQRIAATYGVRVLKMRRSTVDGTPAWLVTVMNPGGDFNDAFQVTTLAVDAETGRLISGFRHRRSGRAESGAARYEGDRQPPETLRRGWIWR